MGVGHVVSQGLWLGSLILLAAVVEPSAFGSLATGMVLVNLAGLLVDSGTRGSIVAAPTLDRAEVRGVVALNLAAGLAATVAIAALAGPITATFADGGDPGAIRALSLGVVLYAAGITPLALLQKNLRFRAFAGANIGAATVSSAVGIAAGLAGAGVWALVVRQLVSMALLSVIAWALARGLFPAREPTGERRRIRLRQAGWIGFFMLAPGLGLYSLAFTLAFAPVTQVSWQVGRVLFPAAAATADLATVARRTLVSLRMMGLILLPFVPPAIVLAPTALPGLLGDEWKPMVAPFQILLAVGVGHAMVVMLGESLSGTGNIGWRARVNAVWAAGMLGALVWLVSVDGIRGAALAHALLFVPFALAYGTFGARKIGLDARRIAGALAPLVAPFAAQCLVTFGGAAALETAGVQAGWAAGGGAVAGVLVIAVLLLRLPSSPLGQARSVLSSAVVD
jgi:O-antigen/teichoic acid export membrane protein